MSKEFMTFQQLAGKRDRLLNQAVAKAIDSHLRATGQQRTITCEKHNVVGSQLCPDILVSHPDGSIICLELTWRSTGKYIEVEDGERRPQNTLTSGHIMKYLLEKVMEYVKDFKL
jgi:hypothetical protein